MFSPLVIALAMLAAPEAPSVTINSTLAGAPERVDRSLTVGCGERVYSFKFGTLRGDTFSIEFDREPVKPSEKLSAEVVDAFRQFSDVPSLEASCSGAGSLYLEITGPLEIDQNEAYAKCVQGGGLFDHRSWRLLIIEDDVAHFDGDDIGKCTTKDDIDEFNRLTRGSVK